MVSSEYAVRGFLGIVNPSSVIEKDGSIRFLQTPRSMEEMRSDVAKDRGVSYDRIILTPAYEHPGCYIACTE